MKLGRDTIIRARVNKVARSRTDQRPISVKIPRRDEIRDAAKALVRRDGADVPALLRRRASAPAVHSLSREQ